MHVPSRRTDHDDRPGPGPSFPAFSDADATASLFALHLQTIEHAVRFVCRRHHLSPDEGEDFASTVHLRLIEHDCAILRTFRGRSSPRTFLVVVILRMFQDYRVARWGKWRPSAEARRAGPVAVRLETLIMRDRLTPTEAFETLRTSYGATETDADLRRLWACLPVTLSKTDDSRPADENNAESSASAMWW